MTAQNINFDNRVASENNSATIYVNRLSKAIIYGVKLGSIASIIQGVFIAATVYLTGPAYWDSNGFSINYVSICIYGPIAEELIFRLGLYDGLKRIAERSSMNWISDNADRIASIVSSALFGLVHNNSRDFFACAFTGFKSYLTTLEAYKRHGLLSSIAAHSISNAILAVSFHSIIYFLKKQSLNNMGVQ